jgi:predicted RNA-binding protein associated with RNAse of E/G family
MIHSVKKRSSAKQRSPKNEKIIEKIDENTIIEIEKWHDSFETLSGKKLIAQDGHIWRIKWHVGQNYIIKKFMDEKNQLTGVYCDVCSPIVKNGNVFACDDWYLDIWWDIKEGKKPEILDKYEFEAAVSHGFLTPEQAEIAQKTAEFLLRNIESSELLLF